MQRYILSQLLWIALVVPEQCVIKDATTYHEDFEVQMTKAIQNQGACETFVFDNATGSLDESVLSLIPDEITELQISRSRITYADICSPPSLRKISILNNIEFPELDYNVMAKCEDLGVLEISNVTLQPTAFRSMSGLQVLILQDINIDHLSLLYIQPLENLGFLRIAKCRLRSIDSEVLCPLTLKRLNLINNEVFPRLTITLFDSCFNLDSLVIVGDNYQIDDDAFNTMAKLEKLYLVQTTIETLTRSYFRALFNLRLLHLSENDIKVVEADAFFNLHSLEMLNLKYSEIEVIKPGTFRGLTSLEVLDLTGNRLKTMDDIGEIPSLKKLDVSWNLISEVKVEELERNFTNLNQFVIFGNSMSCAGKKRLISDLEAEMDISVQGIWGGSGENCA